ncbi:MAG: hypothetical protein P1V36_11065 [Planctomycetota bacterium]|nr:hypothetical protein [Planctomycetota bacterium]
MRRVLAFALIFALVPLAGCLKAKDHITLNKDGSGTIVSTYDVDLTKTRELLSAVAMLMGQGDPAAIAKMKDEQLMNFEHPNWFKKASAEVEGYDVTSATQSIVGEKDGPKTRKTTVNATFESLVAASAAKAFPITSVTLSKVEKSEKLPNGAWKLVLKDAFSGLDPAQTGGMDPSQMMPMFEPQLKKLTTTFAFTIPGKILETNGTKSDDGCTASMVIDYNKMMEGKEVALNIVFEAAEGAKLKPFAYTPDLMSLMPRIQGQPPVLKDAAENEEGGGAEAGEGEAKPDGAKKADGEKKPEPAKSDAGK